MENPGPWVVGGESNGHVVTGDTSRDDITADGVVVVVDRATSAANDGKFVLSKTLGVSSDTIVKVDLHRGDGKDGDYQSIHLA